MKETTKLWFRGMISAVIGAVATSVTVLIVDPETFNLFQGGALELAKVAMVSAIVALGMFLKASPLPPKKAG